MTAAGASAPERAGALKEAWSANCFQRERAEAIYGILAVGLLIPPWLVLEVLLEPRWLRPFGVARALDLLGGLVLFVAVRRARSLTSVRLCMALAVSLGGAVISFMLPRVDHYFIYLFGFGLLLLGAGPILSSPLAWVVGDYAVIVCVAALQFLLHHGPRTMDQLLGTGFFVSTGSILGITGAWLRRRVEYRAFLASFELGERNRELGIALDNLRDAQARLVAAEKLSALGRLLAGLSHELNNPINVIHNNHGPLLGYVRTATHLLTLAREGRTEELARQWDAVDADFILTDLVEGLETIGAASQRIRGVHADLRTLIRGDAPALVEGDLNEGLRSTVAMVTRHLPEGVTVECDCGPLPRSAFHPGQLNQVWLNVLQNALDAVGDAGRVQVISRVADGALQVEVIDTGPGVRPDVRARLFEPFVTTKDVGKGTGLGLATCYQILERHGGSISLDDAHAPGARFVVRLPLRPPALKSAATDPIQT